MSAAAASPPSAGAPDARPGGRAWPRPHVVIALAFTAFLVGEALLLDVTASRALVVALSAGLGLVFVLQPRAPLLTALLAHVFLQARIALEAGPVGTYGYVTALLLMFFGVGAYGAARGRALRIAVLFAVTVGARGAWLQFHLDAAATTTEALSYWTFYLALMVLGTGLGLVVRDRGDAVRALTRRVERLEASLDGSAAAAAAAAEQRRVGADIRRLVSDLVARIDGVLGQAERTAAADPERTESLLATAGDAAREAMERMRATLGRLRADGEPARAIHPGAAALQDLVATLEQGGARVRVSGSRTAEMEVPEVLVLAADRIVAAAPDVLGAAPREAELRLGGGALELRLRTAARAGAAPGTAAASASSRVALAERVRLLGGELRVHARRGRLTARLPFAAAPTGDPVAWRRPRAVPAMPAAVAFLLALGLLDQLVYAGEGPLAPRLLVAVALPLPLLLVPRRPPVALLAFEGILIAGSAHGTLGGAACQGTIGALLCAFVFGVRPWRLPVALGALVLLVAGPMLGMRVEDVDWPVQSYLAYGAWIAGTWGAGRLVRDRVAAAADVRAQLGELDARRRRAEAQAAELERARLAREIHDVVGHAVAVVCIQAGVGERLAATRRADGVREAIVAARGAAATAARELDRLSDLLPADAGPGLADLSALVDRLQSGGMRVELRLVVAEPVAPALAASAHRVVQEALTNAAKHAAGAAVSVEVEARDGRLRIEVRNGAGRSMGEERGGHGLPGMRERVAEHGGTLRAGPFGGGGWSVTAWLPLDGAAVYGPRA